MIRHAPPHFSILSSWYLFPFLKSEKSVENQCLGGKVWARLEKVSKEKKKSQNKTGWKQAAYGSKLNVDTSFSEGSSWKSSSVFFFYCLETFCSISVKYTKKSPFSKDNIESVSTITLNEAFERKGIGKIFCSRWTAPPTPNRSSVEYHSLGDKHNQTQMSIKTQ